MKTPRHPDRTPPEPQSGVACADVRAARDCVPVGLVVLDRRGTILDANLTLAAALGVPRSDLIQAALSGFLTPTDRAAFHHHLDDVFSARGRHSCEVRLNASDGTLLRVDSVAHDDGEEVRCSAALSPVQPAEGEGSLHRSDELFRQLAENVNEVFWLTDWIHRELLYVSPAYERIFGHSCQRLYANRHSWHDLIHEEDRQRVAQAFADSAEAGRYVEEEYRIVHGGSGQLRWIRDRAFTIRDPDGRVSRVIGLAEDITDRKQAEAELARYRRRLEALVDERTGQLEKAQEHLRRSERLASLGTLAAGIAHEINNPLSIVLLCSEAIRSRVSDPEAVEALDDLEKSTRRCSTVISKLLRFASENPSGKSTSNLGTVVGEAVEVTRAYADHRGVTVAVVLDESAGPARMNAGEIEQVLINLIRNGVHASDPGATITVATQSGGDTTQVVVRDTGCGMTAEQQARAFDPFFTTRRNAGGSGLGLSICHGIVRDHDGEIEIESVPNKGTSVTISLPAERA
ncbi:MAG: PAS domain-containing protein [bacterium]|nr:PAS domain-containing protein [bacterium]